MTEQCLPHGAASATPVQYITGLTKSSAPKCLIIIHTSYFTEWVGKRNAENVGVIHGYLLNIVHCVVLVDIAMAMIAAEVG